MTYKREDHKGRDQTRDNIHVTEDTWSVGAEYMYKPVQSLFFAGGLGFDALLSKHYWGRISDWAAMLGQYEYVVSTEDRWLIKGQAGAFWEFIDEHELPLTFARKNHFPTMSQRYSTRFGETMPNPGLDPEMVNQYEVGYKGQFGSTARINTSVYYSNVTDKISNITIADSHNRTVNYAYNIDEAVYYGFEFAGEAYLGQYIAVGGAFSWNKYDLPDSPKGSAYLTYFPEIATSGYVIVTPQEWLSIMPRVEYTDTRYVNAGGSERLGSYMLAHLKVTADIGEHFIVSTGVDNIFDKLYEIRDGFPMPGRTYTFSLTAKI